MLCPRAPPNFQQLQVGGGGGALAAAAKTAQDPLYSQEMSFLLTFQSFHESSWLQVSTDAQLPAAGLFPSGQPQLQTPP